MADFHVDSVIIALALEHLGHQVIASAKPKWIGLSMSFQRPKHNKTQLLSLFI